VAVAWTAGVPAAPVGGHRGEPVRFGQHGLNLTAAVGQVPGGDQAPAAVTARPGQDRHRGGRKTGDRQLAQAASGDLHHLDELDVQVLDHGPVDSAHLLGGQRRDRAAAHGTHRPPLFRFGPPG